MKRLFSWGLLATVILFFTVACSNPLLGSDGEVAVITDLTATVSVGQVTLAWVEPEVEFTAVQFTYSAADVDAQTIEVSKGDLTVVIDELTANLEYTFEAALIATNTVVATEATVITATPMGVFLAPYSPEIIGAGTPNDWDGNGAMTKVSENEWTYTFNSDGTSLDFKVRELGNWDNAFTFLVGEEIEIDTKFTARTGDELPNMVIEVPRAGEITVTFWFNGEVVEGEEQSGEPEVLISFTPEAVADFSPQILFTGGTFDEDTLFMGMVSQNQWEVTFDVTAADDLQFIVQNSAGTTQYGDAVNTVASGTTFNAAVYDDSTVGSDIAFIIPARTGGNVKITFWFNGEDGTATAPEIQVYAPEPITYTLEFVGFTALASTSVSLTGSFTGHFWENNYYHLTFDAAGAASIDIADQVEIDTLAFRLFNTDSWDNATGLDYTALEPNAHNVVSDAQYDNGDPNWAVGNSGVAKPTGGFVLGNNYTITIDASAGGRATLAIDGTVVWE